MRFYYDEEADDNYRHELYGNAITALVAFPPLMALIAGFLLFPVFQTYISTVAFFPLVSVILVTGIFTPLIKLLIGFFRVQRKPVAYIVFNICFFTTQTLIIILAVGVMHLGLVGQVYSQLTANFLFWLVSLAILLRYTRPMLSAVVLKRLLAFGVPMIPFFVFMWINNSAGRFMLEQSTTLEHVGIFALAAQFSGLLLLFGNALDNALIPNFFRTGARKDGQEVLGMLITRYIALFGILGLVINVCAPPFILLVSKPAYHDAVNYVGLLTLSYWLFVCAKPVVWSLSYSKRTGLLSMTRAASVVLLIAALAITLWVMDLGITGVILAMIIANIFTIVFGYSVSQRLFHLVFPYRKLVVSALAILAGGLIIETIPADSLAARDLIFRGCVLILFTAVPVRILGLHAILSSFRSNRRQ
jgi:O-antigen/teichoic acid export membrane protein